jgi:hypothetical protein
MEQTKKTLAITIAVSVVVVIVVAIVAFAIGHKSGVKRGAMGQEALPASAETTTETPVVKTSAKKKAVTKTEETSTASPQTGATTAKADLGPIIISSKGPFAFDAYRGNFIAQSNGLTAIKVWYVPSGTGAKSPVYIGNMTVASVRDGVQTWSMQVPPNLLATKIYAVGYVENLEIGTVDYPYEGAAEIDSHLY